MPNRSLRSRGVGVARQLGDDADDVGKVKPSPQSRKPLRRVTKRLVCMSRQGIMMAGKA